MTASNFFFYYPASRYKKPIDLKAGITEVNIDHVEYTVQSEEEVTEISLLKVAVDEDGNKKPLAGATLILSDSQGTEIERWVSEETAHIIKGLKIGETYTVTEEGNVEGYPTGRTSDIYGN